MPLYDYRCPGCGDVDSEFIHSISQVDEIVVLCSKCGSQKNKMMNVGVKMQTSTGHFFQPYMEHDLGPDPVQINSVDHLQEECRKRGLGCKKMPPKPAN